MLMYVLYINIHTDNYLFIIYLTNVFLILFNLILSKKELKRHTSAYRFEIDKKTKNYKF